MGQMFQAALNAKQFCKLFQVCFIRFLLIQQKRHDNIFFRRQNRKQIKLLKNKSNPFPAECRQLLIAVTVNIFTIVGQRAGRWLIQAGKQMQQGTFSASRWPHDRNKIAGYNFEICTIQSHHSVFTVTINL